MSVDELDRRQRRQLWFAHGALAVRQTAVDPPVDEAYACPLCLEYFDNAAFVARDITDEHVPPRSVGGSPLVLTCGRCNSQSGKFFDEAMADEEKQRTFGTPYVVGTLPAVVSVDGVPLRGKLRFDGKTFEMIGHDGQNPPALIAKHAQQFELGVSGMDVTFQTKGTNAMSSLGWVRAAYLAAFAMYGYRYVGQAAFAPLRAAIANPAGVPFDPVVLRGREEGPLDPMVVEVLAPDEVAGCRAVMFGPRFILLPPMGASEDWFRTLRDRLPGGVAEVRLQWFEHMRFPDQPLHLLDG